MSLFDAAGYPRSRAYENAAQFEAFVNAATEYDAAEWRADRGMMGIGHPFPFLMSIRNTTSSAPFGIPASRSSCGAHHLTRSGNPNGSAKPGTDCTGGMHGHGRNGVASSQRSVRRDHLSATRSSNIVSRGAVTIAVVDDAVDTRHREFAGRVAGAMGRGDRRAVFHSERLAAARDKGRRPRARRWRRRHGHSPDGATPRRPCAGAIDARRRSNRSRRNSVGRRAGRRRDLLRVESAQSDAWKAGDSPNTRAPPSTGPSRTAAAGRDASSSFRRETTAATSR